MPYCSEVMFWNLFWILKNSGFIIFIFNILITGLQFTITNVLLALCWVLAKINKGFVYNFLVNWEKQGSGPSPLLFAMVMDMLLDEVKQESMVFAGDIVIWSESLVQVEENLERRRGVEGMKMSWSMVWLVKSQGLAVRMWRIRST